MKSTSLMLFAFSCLVATPLVAQTQIGGGTCSSSTLNGTYAFNLTGRQITSSGSFSNVFQSNGSAIFDGLSGVKVTLTSDTLQAVAAPLTWSGTYSMQSNCAGLVTITSGGSATFNLVLYNQGADFLVTGNDGVYSYSGSGNTQPSGCSTSTFSGVYTFTGTGFGLSGTAVNDAGAGTGLLQFDGQGNVTVNLTTSSNHGASKTGILTGSYSVSSNCLGSATLSSGTNSYVMSFSISSNANPATVAFFADLAQSGKFMLNGTGHAIYGQPATTAATGRPAAAVEMGWGL